MSKIVYLSGAMQFAPDDGNAWRLNYTPKLRALGYEVINPVVSERIRISPEERKVIDAEMERQRRGGRPGCNEWMRFRDIARRTIFEPDMADVLKSDILLCWWEKHCAQGAGTKGEITIAAYHRKPVIIVPADHTLIPVWIQACATAICRMTDALDMLQAYAQENGESKKGKGHEA